MAKVLTAFEKRAWTVAGMEYVLERYREGEGIIGADLSLRATGLVRLAHNGSLTHALTTGWKTTYVQIERIRDQAFGNMEILEGSHWCLVYEDVNVGSHHNGIVGVALGVGGLFASEAIARREVNQELPMIISVINSQIKKFAAGSGKADKEQVMRAIEKQYGIVFADDNQADAYGAASIGQAVLNLAQNLKEAFPHSLKEYDKTLDKMFRSVLKNTTVEGLEQHQLEVARAILANPKLFKVNSKGRYEKTRKIIISKK